MDSTNPKLVHMITFNWFPVLLLFSTIYGTCLIIYRLYLSPLSGFPGPKLAAMTRWYEMYFDVIRGGQFMWEIDRMHEKYGPIVRINPYELHIKDPIYYNTVYTGPTMKRDKYSWFLSAGAPNSLFSTAGYNHHRLRRGMLSPYLSKPAIRTLEPVIQEKVNLLCRHMRDALRNDVPLELHRCFISLAVDIVSQYAFGKSNGFNVLQEKVLNDNWKDGVTGAFANLLLARHFHFIPSLFRGLPVWLTSLVVPATRHIEFMESVRSAAISNVSLARCLLTVGSLVNKRAFQARL